MATQFPAIFPVGTLTQVDLLCKQTNFCQIMNSIPDVITEWLQPAAKPLLKFKRVSHQLITALVMILNRGTGPKGRNRAYIER